jgi:serine/threonine-protein kinase
MTFDQATATLRARGLLVTKVEVFDAAKPGTVVTQQPDAQLLVKRGSTVKVSVSKGPELTVVPDVRNRTQQEATDALTGAGFRVTIVQKQSETVAEGLVIATDPAGGKRAPKGSAITVTVSTGTPLVTVPDLTCMTRAQAKDAAAHAGFEIVFEGRKNANVVVDQDPVPNSKAHKGSTITAVVGFGSTC